MKQDSLEAVFAALLELLNRSTKEKGRRRKVEDVVTLYCSSMEEAEEVIRDRPFVEHHLIRGVKRMMRRGSETESCLEIIDLDTLASIWIAINRNEVLPVLDNMIQKAEAAELYERCAEVLRLKRKWETKYAE
jgi:hypothetical protein